MYCHIVKAFVKKTGYPIIAKPDNGVGASGTTKICNDQASPSTTRHFS